MMSRNHEAAAGKDEKQNNNDDLPMAIQIFLWRQTSPFIRPKFGKFHEATCVLCSGNEAVREIKEACKIFEKVLVQNIQFGLSPSFTSALQLIPRWRFIVATLPHVMHCAAAMLQHRKESSFNLGSAETKLLYTLHWILLDAGDEIALQCAENDPAKFDTSPFSYLFPITAITTFVYLFAPICGNVRESDFMQNFRLENGKKIWQALWEYRHPDAECFTTPVKPRRHVARDLKKIREKGKKGTHGIFLGEGDAPGSPIEKPASKSQAKGKWLKLTRKGLLVSAISRVAEKRPSVPSTSRPSVPNASTITSPDKNSSTTEPLSPTAVAVAPEKAVVHGGESSSNSVTLPTTTASTTITQPVAAKPSFAALASALKSASLAEKSSKSIESVGSSTSRQLQQRTPSTPADTSKPRPATPPGSQVPENKYHSPSLVPGVPSDSDNALATFLDVAVIRCLFISHWGEEGVYWALMFFNRRLKGITSGEVNSAPCPPPRKRSNSVPMPKIEVTLSPGAESDEVPEIEFEDGSKSPLGSIADPVNGLRPLTVKDRKKSIIGNIEGNRFRNFRTFVESKILSKSDRSLEMEGAICPGATGSSLPTTNSNLASGCATTLANGKVGEGGGGGGLSIGSESSKKENLQRRRSHLSMYEIELTTSRLNKSFDGSDSKRESATIEKPETILSQQLDEKDNKLVKGKSMPSLSSLIDELRDAGHFGVKKDDAVPSSSVGLPKSNQMSSYSVPKPIITVTEFTPGNTPDKVSSADSSATGGASIPVNEDPDDAEGVSGQPPQLETVIRSTPSLCRRSRTDSIIVYTPPTITEAPGSTFYIKRSGELDYVVLLKALHKISLRENICTLRVCDVVLQLLSTLIDLGLLAKKNLHNPVPSNNQTANNGQQEPNKSERVNPAVNPNLNHDETPSDGEDNCDAKCDASSKKGKNKPLTVHNIFMDVVIRILKVLGCKLGCHENNRGNGFHSGIPPPPPPSSMYCPSSNGVTVETLRSRGVGLMSRLLWYDKRQFRQFLKVLVETRDIHFLITFFHSYLVFCNDPTNPFSFTGQNTSSNRDKRFRAFFKSGQDLSISYAKNFVTDGSSSQPTASTAGVETVIVTAVFKPLVTKLVDKLTWLKSAENTMLYSDVRGLLSYVRTNHGAIYRRTILCAMLDSTKNMVKTQCKIEPRDGPNRMPVGSYTNIECRESPLCSIADENETSKLTYRKSVFKKKSTSSTATSLVEGPESPMTRGGSPAGSLTKKHNVLSPVAKVNNENNIDRKASRIQMALNWFGGKSFDDRTEATLMEIDYPASSANAATTVISSTAAVESQASVVVNTTSTYQPMRKYSTYMKNNTRIPKGASKQMIKMVKKIGMGHGRRSKGDETDDHQYDLSRTNSYDFEPGIGRDTEVVYYRERHLVPIDDVRQGIVRFSFLLETSAPGTIPDPLLIAALLDLPKAPVLTRACYLLECAHFVHQCNRGQWPTWLKMNLPTYRPSRGGWPAPSTQLPIQRRALAMQLQASKMFHQWAEMLGSRLEEIFAEEQLRGCQATTLITDESAQRQLLQEDEEEDFLDEASLHGANANCPIALKMIACVLLLEITTFLRETYRNLPRNQRISGSRLDPRPAHTWGDVLNPIVTFGRAQSRDHGHLVAGNLMNSSNAGNSGGQMALSTTPSGLSVTTANNRRWSVAAQSIASGHGINSQAGSTPTTDVIPATTMTKLATSALSGHGERKISFVIQDDNESVTSSQTTLAIQGEDDKKGVRIIQGKPFLKRGPSNHSQSSFRRRSIRLAKADQVKRDSKRVQSRKESDPESALNTLGVPAGPSLSSGSSFAAVVLAAAAAARDKEQNNTQAAQPAPPAETAKPSIAAALIRPLPNARSRWKKLTGTAMFINRLALNRRDSNASRRKVSSISISDNSEIDNMDASPGDVSPGHQPGGPSAAPDDKDLSENSLFLIPEEEDHLEQNMPWLRVVTKFINSFNFFCTHQSFCHPNCYRRQMRAGKRMMEASRKVFGEEQEFSEDMLSGATALSGFGNPHGIAKKLKSTQGDSSSTSPERSRKEETSDTEKRFHSNEQHLQQHHEVSCGPTPTAGYGSRKNAVSSKSAVASKKKANATPSPMLKYLKIRVRDLFHVPLSVLNKSACILTDEAFLDVMPVAWELLRETDRDVVGAAASIFIVASVKIPKHALDLVGSEMHHQLPDQRINSILRFQALWRNRHQVWQRLEENGQISMKVVPSQIEFTLPSPKLGVECLPVVDPPWLPKIKTKINTIHDSGQMLLSATKSRKKQQIELVQNVIHAEEEKRRRERENYHITSVPVLSRAAYEPSLYHGPPEEHDDVDKASGDADRPTIKSTVHVGQSIFPSILCTAFVDVIGLLDDHAVSLDGTAVYEVAYQVIWACLVEDSNLFFKYFMEQLTRENAVPIFQTLRALIRFIPKLPQQAAFALYNYVIGFIMFYVRHPKEKGQELIGQGLDTLWMAVHSVQGIMFKDLKQILRKEQVDASILLTANVPSAKKIIVHGPQGPDEGGIPSQFPIGEDVQFCQILREALDFFGIEDDMIKEYFLVDHKTRMIHNPQHYVRDFYFFKRSQYPQLALVHKKPEQAYIDLQRECLTLKFTEIGKVMLIWGILKNVNQVVQRVVFLHEDLIKLPSFPRKALEAELDLHSNGEIGKELYGLDIMHKFNWIRLIARMFEAMAGNFAYSTDIQLFINVINGSVALYSEDAGILRYAMAVIINAAHQFKNIFSNNGYFLVLPSLLRIYSNNQTNELITRTIEYVCKQLYVLHRKPFLLQMFGSVAPILERDDKDSQFGDASKIQPKYFYKLLCSFSENRKDLLHIMELVRMKKPLVALDFCYQGDPENISVLECMSLCVLVVAYDSGTKRARQMLTILESILPYFLQDLVKDKTDPKYVRETIQHLTVAMKALINNCDELTKNYNGPAMQSSGDDRRSRLHGGRGPYSPVVEIDEDSHSRFMGDSSRSRHGAVIDDHEDNEWRRDRYCQPRNSVLNLVSEFVIKCTAKLQEINKKDRLEKSMELLDLKCSFKLVDIAHSLIKMASYDQSCIKSPGLQKYMNEVFPQTDWSQETLRPALATIIRRIDKFFTKIHKSVKMYHAIDWGAAAGLLHGIYATLWKHPYIVNVASLKTLIGTCQCLVVGETSLSTLTDPHAPITRRPELPPKNFCSIVFQLVSLQVLVLGNAFTLEHRLQLTELNHQGSASMHMLLTHDKGESLMLNLLLPLCLKVGCGRKDAPKMRRQDIQFSLGLLLNMLSPNCHIAGGHSSTGVSGTLGSKLVSGSLSISPASRSNVQYNPAGDIKSKLKTSSLEIGFLGLKILLVCFESQLHSEWFHVARTIQEMGNHKEIDTIPLWRFLDFVAMYRTPLFTLLLPFIHSRAHLPAENDHEIPYQYLLRERLNSCAVQRGKSKTLLFVELGQELANMKESLNKKLQEAFLDVSSGGAPRSTPRGSHRTSFIEYVSEVYNNSKSLAGGPHMEVLSVRGHSISSGSVASGSSSLARDISIRSENVQSNRVLSGRLRQREATKSARLSSGGVHPKAGLPNVRRRTSYGGEQTENIVSHLPSMHESKGATSEPKLFRKNTLLQRNKTTRQTVKLFQEHNPVFSDPDYGGTSSETSKLQRQKAQSRKTFKFRKTRKDGRKLKTTTEALENGQDTGIELKVQAQSQQPTTVTLNPALHSAAGNIAATPPPVRGHTCVRGKSLSTNGSRRPPALVFTHDSSLNSSLSSSPSTVTAIASNIASNATTNVASPHSAPSSTSVATQHNVTTSPDLCKNKSGSITFTDFNFDRPCGFNEPGYADDNVSISSRGTSSTVGYRDSFGENDENYVRPTETVPEKVVYKSAPTVTAPPSSHIVSVTKDRRSHHVQHSGPSPLVIFGHFRSDVKLEKGPSSVASTSSGNAATRRRKNYIIFEHNDEDTLI